MNPDRLSVYNYAHLPHIFKPQRRIAEADLPPAADKLDILSNTIERLGEAGYVFIGMDHFSKPDDELAIAQKRANSIAISRVIRHKLSAIYWPLVFLLLGR